LTDSYRALPMRLNALLLAFCISAGSQTIPIQVSDLRDHPIAGAILSTKANGSTSDPTDRAGKTRVVLPTGLVAGDELALVLVNPANLRFLSPWQGRAIVPKSSGFIEIVLGRIGDRAALSNPKVISSLATEIEKHNRLSPDNLEKRKQTLQTVSEEAGFKAADVDAAIRALANDSKHRMLFEAYVKDYPNSPKQD
jgi:hypothetical protein